MAYINGKEILFSAIVDTVEQSQLRELQADNQELATQNNTLTSQNTELTTENQRLTIANQRLTNENTELTAHNGSLRTQNGELAQQNNALTSQNNELTSQNQELTSQNDELTTENQRLETENIEVKARADALEVENDIISAENVELILDKNELLDNFTAAVQGDASEIIIPDGVASIRQYAFYSCGNTTAFVFPETVSLINGAAFANCTNCKGYDFTRHEAVPTLGNVNGFNNINANAKIKVPKSLYSEWIAATNWSAYASYIEAVIDGIASPTHDETMTMTVNTAQDVQMGFYFSDTLTAGTRYVERTWIDYDTERTDVYEMSEAVGSLFTMGEWDNDYYEESGYHVRGEFYVGSITFEENGTYRIYQKYYDAEGNEYETGSYIFEVTI